MSADDALLQCCGCFPLIEVRSVQFDLVLAYRSMLEEMLDVAQEKKAFALQASVKLAFSRICAMKEVRKVRFLVKFM